MFSVEFFKNWWSRPAGARDVVNIAFPMIISTASFALMQFADRIFLTWFDTRAMGAAFSSGTFLWAFVAFPFSIAGYANAFVAQYNGAKEYRQIGPIVWQGVLIGLATAPIVLALAPFYQTIFMAFRHSSEMAALEASYLYYLAWGVAAMIANEALSAFFCGRKKVQAVMTVNLIAVAMNVVLDYYLIFGMNGYCKWEIEGAAIATTISQWFRFICFLSIMYWETKECDVYNLWRSIGLQMSSLKKLFYFGGMGSVQFVFDTFQFSFFIMIVGMLGEKENAASAIAFNLNGLSFMPIIGAGVAVVTLVGNQLGLNRPDLAKRATLSALQIGSIITGFFAILFLFFPNVLLIPYAKYDPSGFEPIRELTTTLLRFVALYIFFETINIVFCSAIKGAGDTRFVMFATMLFCPLLIAVTLVGVWGFDLRIRWCWSVLTASIFASSLVYAFRFYQGKWTKMRLTGIRKNIQSEIPFNKTTNGKTENIIAG